MNLDLASVFAKLARSQEHAQTVRNEAHAWMERNPYHLVKKVNDDSTRYSLILRVMEPAQFQRWTLIMADAFSNLRASLDYLTTAVAICESKTTPPPYHRTLAFPIADTRENFDEAVGKRTLGEISEPVRATFEMFQPYNRPHPMLPPLLSMLRKFNNTDKHRLSRLAYGAVSKGEFGLKGEHPNDGRAFTHVLNFGEVKDGTEVFAIVCDRPSPNMNWDRILLEIIIAMWHDKRDPSGPEYTCRDEVFALFDAISAEVRSIVLAFTK
jgi:hypothetical protein